MYIYIYINVICTNTHTYIYIYICICRMSVCVYIYIPYILPDGMSEICQNGVSGGDNSKKVFFSNTVWTSRSLMKFESFASSWWLWCIRVLQVCSWGSWAILTQVLKVSWWTNKEWTIETFVLKTYKIKIGLRSWMELIDSWFPPVTPKVIEPHI